MSVLVYVDTKLPGHYVKRVADASGATPPQAALRREVVRAGAPSLFGIVFGGTSERPGAELRVRLAVTAGGKYVFTATVGRFR
jgi:hypothetical protein